MNKQYIVSNKDSRYYLTAHFMCSEIGIAILGILFYVIVFSFDECLLIFIILSVFLSILFVMIKLFGMILYYKFNYMGASDPLVIKLIETLKQNKNHSRLIFLLIVTLPYNVNTLYNMCMEYAWLFQFLEYTVVMYILSSFLPYKVLFYYWDTTSYIENCQPTKKQVIKFVFQKTALFVLISILIYVIFEILSSQRPGC